MTIQWEECACVSTICKSFAAPLGQTELDGRRTLSERRAGSAAAPDPGRGKSPSGPDGDPAARDELITHNLRLVVYLAKKYEGSGVPSEDMVSIGTIGLIKAVNTFTPERSIKLATYASRCIGNEILMYLRKSSNRRQEASIDEPLNIDGDGNELLLSDVLSSEENQVGQRLEQDAERASLRRSVEQLSPRERQIMELRFGLLDGVERTQKEVADAIGISQSYISRLEKRIIRQLREQLGE